MASCNELATLLGSAQVSAERHSLVALSIVNHARNHAEADAHESITAGQQLLEVQRDEQEVLVPQELRSI